MFTKLLLRNGLHNRVVPQLLGVDDTENASSSIIACWAVFTELLPGNMLIRSVTLYTKNTYIPKLLLNVETTGIEALVVSGNVFLCLYQRSLLLVSSAMF
jgi:hypothetical protein